MKKAVKVGLPVMIVAGAVGIWVAIVKFVRAPK